MQSHERLIGDQGCADHYHVCRSTIHRLKKAGRLSFIKIGRRYFYSIDELDRLFHHSAKGGERE